MSYWDTDLSLESVSQWEPWRARLYDVPSTATTPREEEKTGAERGSGSCPRRLVALDVLADGLLAILLAKGATGLSCPSAAARRRVAHRHRSQDFVALPSRESVHECEPESQTRSVETTR